MDWNRIKSIFIIAFLILDMFLLSQLMSKYKANPEMKVGTTFEEKLKNDSIEYNDVSIEIQQDHYLSANTKVFTEEDILELTDQHVSLNDGSHIDSILEKTIMINEKDEEPYAEIKDFVKEHVFNGENYGFWYHDDEAGTITFYQKYNDKFLILNQGAHLVFYITEDNDIVSYEQTMLEDLEPINENEDIFSAMKALEGLYGKGIIKSNSKIDKPELGYYTLVSMEATQVLTPTWHFIIDHDGEKEHFFVNAFEGQIIQSPANNEKKVME